MSDTASHFYRTRDYWKKQGPIDIQNYRSQQGRQTQQSTGVNLVLTEETYWPMPTATVLVRCVFLVVVTTTDWFCRLYSHGLPNPGYDWCVNNAHHWRSFTKTVQRGETWHKPFSDFPKCNWIRLELLASPMVQTLRDTNPHNPLASPNGTTPIKPSVRAWLLTSY